MTGKTAYADNENMFRFNTSDLVSDLTTNIRFSNVTGYFATSVAGLTANTAPVGDAIASPTPTNLSNGPITGSQQDLTYSFDIQAQPGLLLHFVVINTDPSRSGFDGPHGVARGRFRECQVARSHEVLRVRPQTGVHLQLCRGDRRQRPSPERQSGPRRTRRQLHHSNQQRHDAVPSRPTGTRSGA